MSPDDDITDRARQHHEAHMEVPDPTPFERIISWVKIAFATKKVLMLVWAFFFGVAGVAVKGNIDEVNPWKEAAVEVGLIEPDSVLAPQDVAKEDEINQLRAEMMNMANKLEAMGDHTHAPVPAHHDHEVQAHTHPYVAVEHAHEPHKHSHEAVAHTHPTPVFEMSDAVKDAIAKEVGLSFVVEMSGHVDILH